MPRSISNRFLCFVLLPSLLVPVAGPLGAMPSSSTPSSTPSSAPESGRWGDPAELGPQCEAGDASACHSLGHAIEEGGGDPARAFRAFERSCEGDAEATAGEACVDVAEALMKGEAGPKDDIGATSYFLEACRAGDGLGCYNGALRKREGVGTDASFAVAAQLFGRGCELDSALACRYLAYLHHDGEDGVEADHDRAEALYQKSCDLGQAAGCLDLADCEANGEADPKRLLGLYQAACKLESGAGCLAYARLLEKNDPGLPNRQQLLEHYLGLACRYGEAEACG